MDGCGISCVEGGSRMDVKTFLICPTHARLLEGSLLKEDLLLLATTLCSRGSSCFGSSYEALPNSTRGHNLSRNLTSSCTASPASHCSAPRHLAHQIHGNVSPQKRPHPNTVGTKVGRPSRNTLPSPRLAASLRTISRSNRVENAVSRTANLLVLSARLSGVRLFPSSTTIDIRNMLEGTGWIRTYTTRR